MGQRAAWLGGLTALCAAGTPMLAAGYELNAGVDPLVGEIVSACSGAIGARQAPPAEAGWHTGGMTLDAQAYVGHDEDYADREWPGVGMLNLSVKVDQFDGRQLGRCSVSIDGPEGGWLPIADFGRADGLVGSAEMGDVVAEGAWRNAADTLFVTARQIDDPGRFEFQMTEIVDAAR
jgi:hypothetical protein